jgi:hypothetical protein
MDIGAIGVQSYIYNTNQVDAASMNRVRAIPSDINAERTDYSGLTEENTNPLRPGQSSNFADILGSQMAMGQQNAARILPAEEEEQDYVGNAIETAVTNNQTQGNQAPIASSREQEDETTQETVTSQAVDMTAQMAAQVNNGADEDLAEAVSERAAVEAREDQAAIEAAGANNEDETAATTNIINENTVTAFPQRQETEAAQIENFELQTNAQGIGESVFTNVIPDALNLPYTNAAVEMTSANAAEETTATEQNAQAQQDQQADMTNNLYQMRRATDAYEMAMGF